MAEQRQSKKSDISRIFGGVFSENLRTLVFEIRHKKRGLLIKSHTLTVLPQTFNLSLASRDTLQHTAGGIFVDRWGRAAGRLTIAGVFLNKTVRLKGGARVDGAAQFKDLRDMLEDYTGARNKDSDASISIRKGGALVRWERSAIELRLLIFAHTIAPSTREEKAREWYRIHLPANYLTFNKSVGDRHANFPYTINLVLLDRLDQVKKEATDTEKFPKWKERLSTAAGRATAWADKIKDISDTSAAAVAASNAAVRNTFGKAGEMIAIIDDFTLTFTGALAAIDLFVSNTLKFIDFPFQKVRKITDTLRRIFNVYSNSVDFPDATQGEIKDTLEYLESALARPEAFLQPLTDSDGREYKSAQAVKVEPGMTIQKLEDEFSVPAEDIIKLNNLAYPYIDDFVNTDAILQEGRKVLRVGDDVLIPIHAGEEILNTTPPDFEGKKKTAEEKFYGIAWRLDKNGNMLGDSSKTRFLDVRGIENVLQALRVRYQTERGAFPVHPLYGMERFIGNRADAVAIEMLKFDLHLQTLIDPRVEAIEALTVEFKEDGLVDAQVTARLKNTRESVLLNVDGLRVA